MKLLSALLALSASAGLLGGVSLAPKASASYAGFEPWWFAGGDQDHVTAAQTEEGILTTIDGKDTEPSDAWKYTVRIPNNSSVSGTEYLSDSFSIEGDHEAQIVFSMDCVNEDGTKNYLSGNGLNDIDLYVYNAENDDQLASIRIWYDAGGYTNGDHSYALGALSNYPNKWNGSTWIVGDAKLSSSFTLGFSREYLFRSYTTKSNPEYTRLDNSKNAFYSAAHDAVSSVKRIYFLLRGDNGWEKQAHFLLRSINGQSLGGASNTILDETPPDIIETSEMPSAIEYGETLTVPLKAVDVLSEATLSLEANGSPVEGMSFLPEKGLLTLKATATDAHGNSSSKTYEINVTGHLAPPTITKVPTIEDQSLKQYDTLYLDAPEFEDETGSVTLSCTYENLTAGTAAEELPYDEDTGRFYKYYGDDDLGGDIRLVYTVTNRLGSVSTDPVLFHVDLYIPPKPDFITWDEGLTVSFVESGVLVHSIGAYRKINFGTFRLRYGIDAYFTIPLLSSNGRANTAYYFDMQFVSKANSNYWIMYRIWLNEEFLHNDSSPTNMYFNLGTPGNSECVDVSDCGWLTRSVDDVDGKFHFEFDYTDGFFGEFRGAMQAANGTASLTTRFFDEAGSDEFEVLFYASSVGSGDDQNTEFIMNELNGQSFENTDGVMDAVHRPTIEIGTINSVYAAHSTFSTPLYVKDILNLHPTVYYRFTDEAGNVVKQESIEGSDLVVELPDPGIYKLKIYIINAKGKEIGTSYSVESRSSLEPVTIDLDRTYEDSYLPGDSVTIAIPTYSASADPSSCTVTMTRLGVSEAVEPGASYRFQKAGTYVLEYRASDQATPNPNQTVKTVYFNVLDTVDPKVTVTISGSMRAEERISVSVEVEDDTDCDVYIILTDSSGYKTIYASSTASFSFDEMGDYGLTVRVTDSYGNLTVKSETLHILKKAPNKVLISWIAIGASFGAVLAGFIVLTSLGKKKARKAK